MPFDPYALCPGGRDKKIRFCCPNMLKELEQVIRLLETDQPAACLSYIETLEQTHPNCACLTKAKISLYRAEERWEEVLPIAAQFYAQEPGNPTAAAEYSVALIANGDTKLAYSTLVDAFELAKADTVHSALIQASLHIAVISLANGYTIPPIAIGNVLKEIPATAEQANMLLFRATSASEVPILFRDWAFNFDCPDSFPGKEAFEEAAILVRLLCWKQALALLEPLAQYAGSWPAVLRNIATVQLWLLENEKAVERLKEYAALPNVPMEDAVDAETLCLFLAPESFGDKTHILSFDYTLTDADKAIERLLSDPAIQYVETAHWHISPKPRGGFVILDRPFPDPETPLTLENAATRLAAAFLYGKETDKEARIDVPDLLEHEQELVESKLRALLGDLIQIPGEETDRIPESRTGCLLEFRLAMDRKRRPDPITVGKLASEYYATAFIDAWLALPLGLFDGKTPAEAAKEPKYHIPLLAVIQSIEFKLEYDAGHVTPILRERLGLPPQDEITVEQSDADGLEDPLTILDAYPVWRWRRFDVGKFSTELLAGGLQVVLGMQEFRAAARFGEELLNRPIDSMQFPVRIMAFEAMIGASQSQKDVEQALLWVDRAKAECVALNIPDAAWYLHEVTLKLMQGDSQGVGNAINHLLQNYGNDADVMESLQELFVQLGMFNPDGTPTAAWLSAMESRRSESQAASPGLWTPDSSVPAAEPSKLWTPDV